MPVFNFTVIGAPTDGSGWVTQVGAGTSIRCITTSGTSATTIYPWQHVDFNTPSATTTTYTTLVPYFDDDPQWGEPELPIWHPRPIRQPVQSPAIITQRSAAERYTEAEVQRRAREIAERKARAAEARTRAHALLLEHLTPEQRRTFEQNNWFIVDGKSGVKYRVGGRSISGNIEVLNKDRVTHRLCGHCSSDIPFHDHLLAQKFMLEHAEEDFVRIANRHPA